METAARKSRAGCQAGAGELDHVQFSTEKLQLGDLHEAKLCPTGSLAKLDVCWTCRFLSLFGHMYCTAKS